MKLSTDADRDLMQHLREQLAADTPYFWGHIIGPDAREWSAVSVARFVQSGVLIPRTGGSYDIVIARVTAPGDRQSKAPKANSKGSQTEKLVSYLTLHHRYGNGVVGNYHPAESSNIAGESHAKPSTVSDFLRREFPYTGSPRDGYVQACKGQAILLHWFMVKHGDSLPVRNADLGEYNEDTIREKY